jgi:hypothetical protein
MTGSRADASSIEPCSGRQHVVLDVIRMRNRVQDGVVDAVARCAHQRNDLLDRRRLTSSHG